MLENNSYYSTNLLRDTLRTTNNQKKVSVISDITKFHPDNRSSFLSKLEIFKSSIEKIYLDVLKNEQNYLTSEQSTTIENIEVFLEKSLNKKFELNPYENSKLERDIESFYSKIIESKINIYNKLLDKNKNLSDKYLNNSKSLDIKLKEYKNIVVKEFSKKELEIINYLKKMLSDIFSLSNQIFISNDNIKFYDNFNELDKFIEKSFNNIKSKFNYIFDSKISKIIIDSEFIVVNNKDEKYLNLESFIIKFYLISNYLDINNVLLLNKYIKVLEDYFIVAKKEYELQKKDKIFIFYKDLFSEVKKILHLYNMKNSLNRIVKLQEDFKIKLEEFSHVESDIYYSEQDKIMMIESSFKLDSSIASFVRYLSPILTTHFKQDSKYIRTILSDYENSSVDYNSIVLCLEKILSKSTTDTKDKIIKSINSSIKCRNKELKSDVLNYLSAIFKKDKIVPLNIVYSFIVIELKRFLLDSRNKDKNIIELIKDISIKLNKLDSSIDLARIYILKNIIENISLPLDLINEANNKLYSFKDDSWNNQYTPEEAKKKKEQYIVEVNKINYFIKDLILKIEILENIKINFSNCIEEKYSNFIPN